MASAHEVPGVPAALDGRQPQTSVRSGSQASENHRSTELECTNQEKTEAAFLIAARAFLSTKFWNLSMVN